MQYLYLAIPAPLGVLTFFLTKSLQREKMGTITGLGGLWLSVAISVSGLQEAMSSYSNNQAAIALFGLVVIWLSSMGLANALYKKWENATEEFFTATFSVVGIMIGPILVLVPVLQPLVARFFEWGKTLLHL